MGVDTHFSKGQWEFSIDREMHDICAHPNCTQLRLLNEYVINCDQSAIWCCDVHDNFGVEWRIWDVVWNVSVLLQLFFFFFFQKYHSIPYSLALNKNYIVNSTSPVKRVDFLLFHISTPARVPYNMIKRTWLQVNLGLSRLVWWTLSGLQCVCKISSCLPYTKWSILLW